MIISPEEFKKLLSASRNMPKLQYATIPEGYSAGRPQLVFDGETVKTIKQYPHLASYTPVAGDRVQVLNGVVQGKIV